MNHEKKNIETNLHEDVEWYYSKKENEIHVRWYQINFVELLDHLPILEVDCKCSTNIIEINTFEIHQSYFDIYRICNIPSIINSDIC